jgi:hypothetical protein
MSEGAIWNLPFWIIGGVTLLLMWLWPMGSDKFGSERATRGSATRPEGLPAASRSVNNPARSHPFPLRRQTGGRPARG